MKNNKKKERLKKTNRHLKKLIENDKDNTIANTQLILNGKYKNIN